METVIFGSVEFFEFELKARLAEPVVGSAEENKLAEIHQELTEEIMKDFICKKSIKMECVQNLSVAMDKVRLHYKKKMGKE